MNLLLIALAILLISGFVALALGRLPRVCTLAGASGALAAGALGLVPVLVGLIDGTERTVRRSWDVPFGSFRLGLDRLSSLFLLPVLVLPALAAIYGSQHLLAHRERKRLGPPWFFYNLLSASMALVVLARNAVLFLVAWEVMSIASYFLVTFEDEKPSVREAGQTYLIATHLGTAFLLAFFLLVGRPSGPLDFDTFNGAVTRAPAGLLFVLALIGFGTRAGFMPLHVWLPEAHPAAPGHVSAVMSGVMVPMGLYGLVRALSFLPVPPAWWGWLLIGVGILSGVGGILLALAQHDLKRLLAYSTIENVGIMALGLGTGLLGLSSNQPVLTVLGFAGSLLHMLNHAVFQGLLFLGAGVIEHATGTREIDRLGGLARRMPRVALTLLIGSIAAAGLPPLNGFVGEFLIYRSAFRGELASAEGPLLTVPDLAVIASLGLIGGLAAIAFTKAFGLVFLGAPRDQAAASAHQPGLLLTVPLYVLAAACVAIGLGSPAMVPALVGASAPLVRLDPESVGSLTESVAGPLGSITLAAFLLIGLVAALTLARALLLSRREVTASDTWGCGYTAPTPRMQYTGSSYVQPALAFFRPLLRTRTTLKPPTGLFPTESSLATETPELARERIYRPVFAGIGRGLSRLRRRQDRRLRVAILYIGAILLALLVWYLGVWAH